MCALVDSAGMNISVTSQTYDILSSHLRFWYFMALLFGTFKR